MLDKIKWFWHYYRKYKYVLFVLIFLTPVQTVFKVSIPRLIEFAVDYVKTGQVSANSVAIWLNNLGGHIGLPTVTIFGLAIISLGLNASMLYAFIQSHRAWMNFRLEWLFRQEAFARLTGKGPDFFLKFRTGDVVTRLTDDVAEKLSWFACSGIFRFYEALLLVAFSLTMMIMINPVLTLWTVCPLPFLILIFFRSAIVLDKRYDHLQTRISKLNAIMEACFSGVRVVKAYVKEKAQHDKFESVVNDRRSAEISVIKAVTIVDSLYMYIWQFGIVIVLLAGGYMVINANLTLGELVAFVYYVVYMIFPMFNIGQFLVKSRQSGVSIDRLVELGNVAPMVNDSGILPCNGDVKGSLEFDNVCFCFDGSGRKIIDNVTLEINAGQTVAIVGKVGAGKSWLVSMIPRLVDPVEGVIRLDGEDLRNYRLEDLRRIVGYVPQEPVLFSDSIRNNIVFGRPGLSDKSIEWAIEVSQLKKEIDRFPKRLDTQIGARGVSISGGQKQRLALARALVANPRLLILDDCTSALDSRTEAALWGNLKEVMPDMTVIMITHRPDMLENADNILYMENGRIIISGTHQELIREGGHYARLYKRYQLAQQVSMVT
jgi:ATP-binding cassette subfamily B multidrug efflux pump